MTPFLNKLVIIGTGLIGGSFALDLKRLGLVGEVVGVGRSPENLERALQLGVIDHASRDAATAVRDADLVLLSTPVGQMSGILAQIAPHLAAHTLVSDAGSTKRDVAALFRQHLGNCLDRCVPAHPIAGSDLSGAAAARYSLYENRTVVLTPLVESRPETVERIAGLWSACGAVIKTMSPDEHDSVFATVSHLPHLLAFAYVAQVAARPNAEACFDLASTGFRDFTRIAGSHPEMWRDIALANRTALLADLKDYHAALATVISMVENSDGAAMAELFETARDARTNWFQRFKAKS